MLVWSCGGGIVVSREGVILCVGVDVWRGNCRVLRGG